MPIATANGKKFTFPDGTTPDQMGEAIDSYFADSQPVPRETQPLADPGVMGAVATEGVSALNRGFAGLPDFVIDAANSAIKLANMNPAFASAGGALLEPFSGDPSKIPSIPRVEDTLKQVSPSFGEKNFMEPGLARTIVQEGSEVAGGFLPSIVSAAPQVIKQTAKVTDKLLRESAPTIDTLKETARGVYKQIDDLGVKVNTEPVQKLADDVARTLKRSGHNVRVTPKAQGVIDELEALAKQGTPPTISEIDTARKVARQAALSTEESERRLGAIAIDKIDDFLNNLPEDQLIGVGSEKIGPLFTEARGLWSRAKKGEVIEEIFRKADLQASGLENGLRIQFQSLLNNKKAIRGFNADEIKALRKVVKGGSGENLARLIGKFGLEQDQAVRALLPGAGAIIGGTLGGGVGAVAVPAIGTVAQRAATQMTTNNAKLASALVRSGKNAKDIARAYVGSVPKAERSAEELALLMIDRGVPKADFSKLAKVANPLISEALFLAGFLSNVSENQVAGGENDSEGQQP